MFALAVFGRSHMLIPKRYTILKQLLALVLVFTVFIHPLAPAIAVYAQEISASPSLSPSPAESISEFPTPPQVTDTSPSPTETVSPITSSTATPTTPPTLTLTPTLIPAPVVSLTSTPTPTSPVLSLTPSPTPTLALSTHTPTPQVSNKKTIKIVKKSIQNLKKYTPTRKSAGTDELTEFRTKYSKTFKKTESEAIKLPGFDVALWEKIKRGEIVSTPTQAPAANQTWDAFPSPTPTPLLPILDPFTLKPIIQKASPTPIKKSPTPTKTPTPVVTSSSSPKQIVHTVIQFTPQHYELPDGSYDEVDSSIIIDETDTYKFRNAAADFVFRAGDILSQGVQYTGADGKVCSFGLDKVEGQTLKTDVKGVAQANTVTYPEIYPGADLQFTVSSLGVKTEIVAKTRVARARSYTFTLYDCTDDTFGTPTASSVVRDAVIPHTTTSRVVTIQDVDESGTVLETKDRSVTDYTVTPDYGALFPSPTPASIGSNIQDGVQSIIGVLTGVTPSPTPAVSVDETVRIDPTITNISYFTFVSRGSSSGIRTSTRYGVGTVPSLGMDDARSFLFYPKSQIVGLAGTVIGGSIYLNQKVWNGDTPVGVYGVRFGSTTRFTDSLGTKINTLAYPGLEAALPGMITIDASGNPSSNPLIYTGVPSGRNPNIPLPAAFSQYWLSGAPEAAETAFPKAGIMLKSMSEGVGFAYRSPYDTSDTNGNGPPSVGISMSTDTPNPDRGQNPTTPSNEMPQNGWFVLNEKGKLCDESQTPAVGGCRMTTRTIVKTGAGDPDGYGPGDINTVTQTYWGDTVGTVTIPNGNGFANYISFNDGVNKYKAYATDKTGRTSGTMPDVIVYTDTTPPTVPSTAALPTYTKGVGLSNVRQIDIVSSGSTDVVNAKVQAAVAITPNMYYQIQYSTSATFVAGSTYTSVWQTNNPLFNIGQNGIDAVVGTADDIREDTPYYLRMKAKDHFGNISAWSTAVTTTFDTLAPIVTPAVLSRVRFSPANPITFSTTYTEAHPDSTVLSIRSVPTVPTPTPLANATASLPSAGYYHTPIKVAGEDRLYIIANSANTGYMIHAKTLAPVGPTLNFGTALGASFTNPHHAVFDGTYVYTLIQDGDRLVKIDPATNTIVTSYTTGAKPLGLAYDSQLNTLWYALKNPTANTSFTLKKISPVNGTEMCTATAPSVSPNGMLVFRTVVTASKIYAVNYYGGYVMEVNKDCSAPTSFALGGGIGYFDMDYDGYRYLYASRTDANYTYKIDTQTRTSVGAWVNGTTPAGTLVDKYGGIWQTYQGSNTLKRFVSTAAGMTQIESYTMAAGFLPYRLSTDGVYIYVGSANSVNAARYAIKPLSDPPLPASTLLYEQTQPLTASSGVSTITATGMTSAGQLPDGPYAVQVKIVDQASNFTKSTDSVVVMDASPANITFSNPPSSSWSTSSQVPVKGQLGIADPPSPTVTSTPASSPTPLPNTSFPLSSSPHYHLPLQVAGTDVIYIISNNTNTGYMIDPKTGLQVGSVLNFGTALGNATAYNYPNNVVTDGTYIYTTLYTGNKLVKINPVTNTIVATYPTDPNPIGLAYDGTNLWYAPNGPSANAPMMLRKVSTSGVLLCTASAPAPSSSAFSIFKIITTSTKVFAINHNTGYIIEANLDCSGALTYPGAAQANTNNLAYDGSRYLYTASSSTHQTFKIDTISRSLKDSWIYGTQPGGVHVDQYGYLWQVYTGSKTLLRFQITGSIFALVESYSLPTNASPNRLSSDGTYMYVGLTSATTPSIMRIAIQPSPDIQSLSSLTINLRSAAGQTTGHTFTVTPGKVAGETYVFTALRGTGKVMKIKSSTSEITKTYDLSSQCPLVYGSIFDEVTSKLYVTCYGGSKLAVIDTAADTVMATWNTSRSDFTRGILTSDKLILPSWDGPYVTVIDTKTGTQTCQKSYATVTGFRFGASYSDKYYASASDNKIYTFDTNCNATIVASNPAGTQIQNIYPDADGIWTVSMAASTASRYRYSDGALIGNFATVSSPDSIVRDQAGYIYVTNMDATGTTGSVITKYTPSGVKVTSYPNFGTYYSHDIKSDGRYLWATSDGAGTLTRIDTGVSIPEPAREDADVSVFEWGVGSSPTTWNSLPYDANKIFDSSITVPGGVQTLTFRTSDLAGNQLTKTLQVATDAIPPAISSINPSTVVASGQTPITFTISDTVPGSGIQYGTSPSQISVSLASTLGGTAITKTLFTNGVNMATDLVSALTCAPSVGASTWTDNTRSVASSVDCTIAFVKDLSPDNTYTTQITTADIAGNTRSASQDYRLDANLYLSLTSPVSGSVSPSSSVTLTGKASRGIPLTITNASLDRSKTYTLDTALNGTGQDSEADPTRLLTGDFMVSCGEMLDVDQNQSSPPEEVCSFSVRVLSDYAIDGTSKSNTISVSMPNDVKKEIRTYTASPAAIGISLDPSTVYFSPNGDAVLDAITFTPELTSPDPGTPLPSLTSWQVEISQVKDAGGQVLPSPQVVRTISGGSTLPTTVVWDAKNDAGTIVSDGAYAYRFSVTTVDGVTLTLPLSTTLLTASTVAPTSLVVASPYVGKITSDGVTVVSGIAPFVSASADSFNPSTSLRGTVHVTICVQNSVTTNSCDYTTTVQADTTTGFYSTLVVLPRAVGVAKTTHTLAISATDSYGLTQSVPAVTVVTDTTPALLSSSVLPSYLPSTPSAAWTAFNTAGSGKSIRDISAVLLKTRVSMNTQYVRLTYADLVDVQSTGLLSHDIGIIAGVKDTDPRFNPDDLTEVKKLYPLAQVATIPQSSLCTNPTGCDWWIWLPVLPTYAGVFDIKLTAVKGDGVSTTSVAFSSDASLPVAPVVLYSERYDATATSASNPILGSSFDNSGYIMMHSSAAASYTNTGKIRLRGAAKAGTRLALASAIGDSTASALPVASTAAGTADAYLTVPDTGVYEAYVDLSSQLTAACGSATCTQSFTLTPTSASVRPDGTTYNTISGDMVPFVYDTTLPQASQITAQTTGPYVITPYGTTGTPITYALTTTKDLFYAQMQRPDTFTRIFDTTGSSLTSFAATFNMDKGMIDPADPAAGGIEGYFSPKITLLDLAGNMATYDASDTTSPLGDYRGRIDNTQPQSTRQPYMTARDGGKAAYDEAVSENSVYLERNHGGVTSRAQTVRLKTRIEKDQRAIFLIDGTAYINTTAGTDAQGLVSVPANATCYPADGTLLSSDVDANGVDIFMPATDKTSSDHLTTQYASLCDVSILYTFAGDGKASSNDTVDGHPGDGLGTPHEAHSLQVQTFDKAGSRSHITAPLMVYHDTKGPMGPKIIEMFDGVYAIGEPKGDIEFRFSSPSGVDLGSQILKTNKVGITALDEFSAIKIFDLHFNDEYGDFVLKAASYDSAGNKGEETTKIYNRSPQKPDALEPSVDDLASADAIISSVFSRLGVTTSSYPQTAAMLKENIAKSIATAGVQPDGSQIDWMSREIAGAVVFEASVAVKHSGGTPDPDANIAALMQQSETFRQQGVNQRWWQLASMQVVGAALFVPTVGWSGALVLGPSAVAHVAVQTGKDPFNSNITLSDADKAWYSVLGFEAECVASGLSSCSPPPALMSAAWTQLALAMKPVSTSFSNTLLGQSLSWATSKLGFGVSSTTTKVSLLRTAGGVADEVVDLGADTWLLNWSKRGLRIDAGLGNNLGSTFPGVDVYMDRTVISIKSMNTQAATYQDAGVLLSTVKGYVNKLKVFKGDLYGLPDSAFDSRILNLAIPNQTLTTSQIEAINSARTYATSQGIGFKVTVVK